MWDVRRLRKDKASPVHDIVHTLAVTGATFSPVRRHTVRLPAFPPSRLQRSRVVGLLSWSQDASKVVTTSNDNTIRITQLGSGAAVRHALACGDTVLQVCPYVLVLLATLPMGMGASQGGAAKVVIRHNNHTGRWLTPFKAIVRRCPAAHAPCSKWLTHS